MSKFQQPADAESHDDVAGLFNRLGARDDTRAYRDFSHSQSRVSTVAKPRDEVPPPVPAATNLPPAVTLAPVTTPVQATTVETPATAAPGRKTPLEQLFQRLAEARSATPGHSPLSRLRQG
ncbi:MULTISPECIES: hypothetical protein [Stenotrophomonas]|nr:MULTISPECIES: hypothetical protein [Stenotrophomonas]MDX5516354.1 hypothetical protein [Stenotrophomonas sp. RG-453]